MSNAYKRLTALFKTAGLTVDGGSYAEAEAYALSVGIGLLEAQTEAKRREIFSLLEADGDAAQYAAMLSLSGAPKELIRLRLASRYGDLQQYGRLLEALEVAGVSFVREGEGLVFTVSAAAVPYFGSVLEGILPPGDRARLNGGGMTFDEWNAAAKSFRFYNKLRLPFCCIDTMEASLLL